MSDADFYGEGFDELEKLLGDYAKKTENVIEILEVGAKEFVSDARKLPIPRSRTMAAGYTHLIDTISYRKVNSEIEVGWGKYYGPMVEKGTRKMSGTPHLKPLFERNNEKYYKKMIEQLGG